jgi:hypothetical protein
MYTENASRRDMCALQSTYLFFRRRVKYVNIACNVNITRCGTILIINFLVRKSTAHASFLQIKKNILNRKCTPNRYISKYQHTSDMSRHWSIRNLFFTAFSTIFNSYPGDQFHWWEQLRYQRKTTNQLRYQRKTTNQLKYQRKTTNQLR